MLKVKNMCLDKAISNGLEISNNELKIDEKTLI